MQKSTPRRMADMDGALDVIASVCGPDVVLVATKAGATVPAPSGEVEQEIASAGTEKTAA